LNNEGTATQGLDSSVGLSDAICVEKTGGKMLAKRQDDMQNMNLQLGSLFIGHIITISKKKKEAK
jgi:hypothetical protein